MDPQSAKQPSYDVGYVVASEPCRSLSYQSIPHETKYCLPLTVTSERLDAGQDTPLPVGTATEVVLEVVGVTEVVGMITEDRTEVTTGGEIVGRAEVNAEEEIVGRTEDTTGEEIVDRTDDIAGEEGAGGP